MKNIFKKCVLLTSTQRAGLIAHQNYLNMQYKLKAVTGSEFYSKSIMNLCKEISTHCVEPNSETTKECYEISYKFIMIGVEPKEVINKLKKFDTSRMELQFKWNNFVHQEMYGYSFETFVFEMLK